MTQYAAHEFADLIERHRGILYKVTGAYCRVPADRDDLAQEIVLQLWRSFGRYDRQLRFSTWMYRVAMNVAISHYRARRAGLETTLPLEDAQHLPAADAWGGAGDELRVLYELIAELDELNRALALLYLDGYSHDEIASVMGLTPTNVATRVGRLKERLRANYMEKTQ